MNFSLSKSIEILERTPRVLVMLLQGVSADWTLRNEGGDTWSVHDILGHLVEGEKTDWVSRMDIILSDEADKNFKPFDRFAQFETSEGKSLQDLLEEFKTLREENLDRLRAKQLTALQLEQQGIHPAFGAVSLAQLIATWTVHDLNHIAQITRVMAKQYKEEVGPWFAYLRILQY